MLKGICHSEYKWLHGYKNKLFFLIDGESCFHSERVSNQSLSRVMCLKGVFIFMSVYMSEQDFVTCDCEHLSIHQSTFFTQDSQSLQMREMEWDSQKKLTQQNMGDLWRPFMYHFVVTQVRIETKERCTFNSGKGLV
jgi:hypothetical protein